MAPRKAWWDAMPTGGLVRERQSVLLDPGRLDPGAPRIVSGAAMPHLRAYR